MTSAALKPHTASRTGAQRNGSFEKLNGSLKKSRRDPGRPLRIAQIAPLYESVPPRLYGGTERVVSWLTEELVARGHQVTLFASGDSVTSAKLVPACPAALWRDGETRETLPQHIRMLEQVSSRLDQFDILHFHCDYVHFPMMRLCPWPSVTTMHGQIYLHDQRELLQEYRGIPLVSISNAQRAPMPQASWCGTVYHGLPASLYRYQPRSGNYLLFLGRISPEKRVDCAIEIALRSGLPLKVAAKIYDEDRHYFHTQIEPLLQQHQSQVEFLGEVGGEAKHQLLRDAKALVFPIDWAEPFGLVMIEALACGTPVVGWRQGSVPEVIAHGESGFIVESIEQAVEAVNRLAEIDRAHCRRCFEERFNATRMAAGYERLYHQQIESARQGRRIAAAGNGAS